MLHLDLQNHRAHLNRVTLRAAGRDTLLVRQRLERALANVDWAAPGLPPNAVLLVRRLEVGAGRGAGFEAGVVQALREQARMARRPWLQADAASAGAVWFADEDELAACLVRDWLQGLVAQRWWWHPVLAGVAPSDWLRERVLARGQRVAPVLAQLAAGGDAVHWLAQLSDSEALAAVNAIAQAYGVVPLAAPAAAVAGNGSFAAQDSSATSALPDTQTAGRNDPFIALLLAAVPELRGAALRPASARLLAFALVAARAPGWLRTAAFAQGLSAWSLGTTANLAPEAAGQGALLALDARDGGVQQARRGAADAMQDPWADGGRAEPLPRDREQAQAMGTARDERRTPPPAYGRKPLHFPPADAQPQGLLPLAAANAPMGPVLGEQVPSVALQPVTVRSAEAGPEAAPSLTAHTAVNEPAPSFTDSPADASLPALVYTQYGGLFYLLNVALALGLYGDFTAPRHPGIALSPWDWLALVGRAWFGDAFLQDPAWPLLATLSGRRAKDTPGQGLAAPTQWDLVAIQAQGSQGDRGDWLAPWGEVRAIRYRSTRTRLRLQHPAGFVLFDVARDPQRRLLLQARALCASSPWLRTARLQRLGSDALPHQPRGRKAGWPSWVHWMAWLLPYLRARLARALGASPQGAAAVPALLCCHAATLVCSASRLEVQLLLDHLPLPIRMAGLDRDPGWIPAAGRSVAFRFV